MKTNKKTFLWIKFILLITTIIVGALVYDQLPDLVPRHRNAAGEVDAYRGNKIWGVLLTPLLIGGIIVLFHFLPLIDPKKENYKKFSLTREYLQITIIGFISYMHIVTLYMSFHPEASITFFMLLGLGSLFVLIGNFLGKIRQNYFVGIRTPWTLADTHTWNKTTRMSGWLFFVVGLISIIEAFVQWYPSVVIFSAIAIAVITPIVYSFLVYKKK